MALLSADQVEAIHEASLHILENFGIEVMSPRALALFEKGGRQGRPCHADGAARPRAGRRGAEDHAVGLSADAAQPGSGRCISAATRSISRWSPGRPMCTTWSAAAAPAIMRDYCDLIRLAQHFNCIHMLGNQVCAPVEMPANSRHLDTYFANLTLTDKSFPRLGDRPGQGARRHRDDGDRARPDARPDARRSRHHHHHLGQLAAPLRRR